MERPLLVDTHCHIHDSEFYTDNRERAYRESLAAGVAMVCVGTDTRSSNEAIAFTAHHPSTYPVIGIHPHETATNDPADTAQLLASYRERVIGIGEIGLDYHYAYSPKTAQIKGLEAQLQLAVDNDLPVSFHVRDAFDDFWPIFDNFHGVRGALHGFTDNAQHLQNGLNRGLYIGLNGISTFTKDIQQQNLLTSVPIGSILFETDAPYLTPKPFRGNMNIPAYVGSVAEFHAHARGMSLDTLINAATANAEVLFGVKFCEKYESISSTGQSTTGQRCT